MIRQDLLQSFPNRDPILKALLLSDSNPHLLQTKIVKCLWFSFVCLGFLGAGLLIGKSYVEWQKSPVSTSISTLSISDLEFPNITVCPPKGSNTALNYDLMKADNHLMTEQQKEKLSHDAYSVFVEAPFQEHLNRLLSQVNPENTKNLFRGYQSLPKVTDENVTETLFCSINGTFHTPWFGGDFEESFFKSDQQHRVRLEFPENLKDQIGSGRLVIEIEVDTREELGLQETVWIRNDTAEILRYKFHPEAESWEDAERICDAEGGHLASIQTLDQQILVVEITPVSDEHVWVGATSNETAGVWEWESNHTCTAVRRSTGSSPLTTYDEECSKTRSFICQVGRTNLSGKTSLRLTYTKDEPTFSFFHVQYSYTQTHSEQQTSWNERQVTGFKLSWKIQNKNPPLYLETEEVGSVTETLLFKGPYQPEFYKNDHSYVVTLKVPENLSDQIGKGSLFIEVEVDLREGWTEEVQISKGGSKVFTTHLEEKTWHEADSYCQSIGGNLVSVESEEELQNIDISSYSSSWIGGIYEEGRGNWSWSDGSPWLYSPWGSGFGRLDDWRTGGRHCVYVWHDKKFYDDDSCTTPKSFICQTTWHTLKESANLTFNYSRELIPLTVFKVRYNYAVSQNQLSDPGKGGQMTGFKLDWFIRDSNGSRLTNGKEAKNQDWKPLVPAPKYENPWLVRMVELARQARLQNIPIEGLVKRSLNNKKLSRENFYCKYGLLVENFVEELFTELEGTLTPIASITSFQNVDFNSGAKIFFAMNFCLNPMPLKLLIFFKQMFNRLSPRAMIRIVVDTIQSGIVDNRESKKSLNELYLAMEKRYDLQYGKFLLALSSEEELEAMMNKGWPFFAKYSQQMDLCLNGTTCTGVGGIISKLGKRYYFSKHVICFVSRWPLWECCNSPPTFGWTKKCLNAISLDTLLLLPISDFRQSNSRPEFLGL